MSKLVSRLPVGALLAFQALAADVDAAIQTTFVKPWMQVVQSKDPGKVMRLFHPKLLACLNDRTREYLDYLAREEVNNKDFQGGHPVIKIAAMDGPPPAWLPTDAFPYPVRPTHEVRIEWGDTTFIRYLAEANGSWYEIFPCPNEKGLAFMREQIAKGIEQRNRAAQLASELKNPLLAELKDLTKQKRLIDAINRYQEATGADLTTAKMVIDVVQGEVASK